MTNDEFKTLREQLNKHCEELLNRKEKEYSDGVDRLCQFKSVAAFRDISPMDALAGMMVKQESSIHQMCKAANTSGTIGSYDQWIEKIGDLRNYCDLLWAVVNDYRKDIV